MKNDQNISTGYHPASRRFPKPTSVRRAQRAFAVLSWTLLWAQVLALAAAETPNKSLASGVVLTIRQTWSQEPSGLDRSADVLVPAGKGPFPVVILLHGMGGNSSFIHFLDPYLNPVIRVAPNGYLQSWNIDAEPSKAPDVAFIRDLINLLKTYDNVDARKISLAGLSNGSALINRLLIELDGSAFRKAACISAQMITKMYHDGGFWYDANGTNNYNQSINPASGRKIITISGTADRVVPYLGGNGVGTRFLGCQESLYRFAQAMGETGPQIADADGIPRNLNDSDPTNDYSPFFVKYSYLNGDVIHYKLTGGDHILLVNGSNTLLLEARRIIADFLLADESALTVVPAAPGKATISWSPAPPGFVLQETQSLTPANWSNALSGATNPSTVPATAPVNFYRLEKR